MDYSVWKETVLLQTFESFFCFKSYSKVLKFFIIYYRSNQSIGQLRKPELNLYYPLLLVPVVIVGQNQEFSSKKGIQIDDETLAFR